MIVIIPCGSAKRKAAAPAQHLYVGGYFKANLEWALSVAQPENVFILSAKHGLLPLGQVVEPYDQFMGDPGSISPDVVSQQIDRFGIRKQKVYALGGINYIKCLKTAGLTPTTPVSGLGMGKQIQALKKNKGKLP